MNGSDLLAVDSWTSLPYLLAKVTFILTVAWTIHRLVLISNPRWRILLWRITPIGVLAVTFLSLRPPVLTLPLLDAIQPETAAIKLPPPTDLLSTRLDRNLADSQSAKTRNTQSRFGTRNLTNDSSNILPRRDHQTAKEEAPIPVQANTLGTLTSPMFLPSEWSLSSWAILIWTVGVLFGLALLSVGLMQVARLCQAAKPVPAWVESELTSIAAGDAIGSQVIVKQSNRLSTPISVGLFHRMILLPDSMCQEIDVAERRAILAHELAHFAGGDVRWNFFLQLAAIVFWFHPLAWRIRLAHADACDQRCDAIAAGSLTDAAEYGRLLARMALEVSGPTPVSTLSIARRSSICKRIALLQSTIDKSCLSRTKVGTLSLSAISLMVLIGAIGVSRSVAEPLIETQAIASIDEEDAANVKLALAGRIVDETGAPVTDAQIILSAVRGGDRLKTTADKEGHYQFDTVEQGGNYRLQVESQRWVGINFRDNQIVNLSPTVTKDIELKLQRACRLRIRTLDNQGKPVRGVQVLAKNLADDSVAVPEAFSTNKDGWATLGGLAPSNSKYIVGTMHDDYGFAKLIVELDNPNKIAEHNTVLRKGETITGTAVCSDGKPPTGWRIVAMPSWWNFGRSSQGTVVGTDGSFVLPHIVPGKYDVSISIPNGDNGSIPQRVLSEADLSESTRPLQIKLDSLSPASMVYISGRVNLTGQLSKDGFWIFAKSQDNKIHSSFYLRDIKQDFCIGPVPPGDYTLRIDEVGTESKPMRVTAPAENVELKLVSKGLPHLIGTVVDAENKKPIREFRVRVLKLRTLSGPNFVQDANWREFESDAGNFELEVLSPGIYQLLVAADGFAWTRSELINTIENGGKPVQVSLESGMPLRGFVTDEQGKPVDGATVIPVSKAVGAMPNPQETFSKVDGAARTVQGKFVLPHLAPGEETLAITHPEYSIKLVPDVAVGASGDKEPLQITLARGGTVRGYVYDSQGKPEPNVTLFISDDAGYGRSLGKEEGRIATVVTDDDGFYEVQHLPSVLCNVDRAEPWNSLGVVYHSILPENGRAKTLDLGGENPLSGRLLINGVPLSDGRVVLAGDNPNFGVFKAYALTDADGKFTFWSPPHGVRTLYYGVPGIRNDWIRASDITFGADTREIGEIDVRSVKLNVTITGLSKEQAAESRVSLIEYNPRWPHGNEVGSASSVGPIVIEPVPPGKYELICRRSDSVLLRKGIEVLQDDREPSFSMDWPTETGTLEISLDASLCGPGGCNPPNLWSDDQRIQASLYSPNESKVRLEQLPAGRYYLTDKDIRDAPHVLEITVEPGKTTIIDLTPESFAPKPLQMGMLVIRCFTKEGVPITGCDTTFQSRTGSLNQSSAQQGRQVFIGDPGNYNMSVSFPGYESISRDITVNQVAADGRPVGEFEIDIRLTEDH